MSREIVKTKKESKNSQRSPWKNENKQKMKDDLM